MISLKYSKNSDRILLFLWVQDPDAEEMLYQYMRWCVVVLRDGITSSLKQLEMVLTYHVNKFIKIYPRTATAMLRNTFVDEVIWAGERREDILQIVNKLNAIAAFAKDSKVDDQDPQLQLQIDALTTGVAEDPPKE